MVDGVNFKVMEPGQPTLGLLSGFNRYQEVRRSWRRRDGAWSLEETPFVESWGADRLREVERELSDELAGGGFAVTAHTADGVVGFATISSRLFGPASIYLQMPLLHVSHEWRGKGIGRMLFRESAKAARALGAKRMYISAQSSEETQAFYRGVGCRDAEYPDTQLVADEPFDVQLEFWL